MTTSWFPFFLRKLPLKCDTMPAILTKGKDGVYKAIGERRMRVGRSRQPIEWLLETFVNGAIRPIAVAVVNTSTPSQPDKMKLIVNRNNKTKADNKE